MVFDWNKEYNLGIKEIDNQHKQLVQLIDKLNYLLHNFDDINQRKEELFSILNELKKYASVHFSTEEKYFEKFNYKFKDEHKKKHNYFKKKLSEFIKKYETEDFVELSFKLLDFLEKWFVEHLLNEDKKYVSCFKKHGLS